MVKYRISERRACDVLGQHRSTQRYVLQRPAMDEPLARELRRISRWKPHWGYKRAHKHLKFSMGWDINPKPVQRVWAEQGLRATKAPKSKQKALGSAQNAVWNLVPEHPHAIWTLDFKEEKLRSGRKYRILNVLDEFTRRGLGSPVEHSFTTKRMQIELTRLFRAHGRPGKIRTDNGSEIIPLEPWLAERGIELRPVEKGKPQQNAYIESYNSTMEKDLLSWEYFDTLLEARTMVTRWRTREYNAGHRHSALYGLTPNEFAQACRVAAANDEPYPPVKLAGVPLPKQRSPGNPEGGN